MNPALHLDAAFGVAAVCSFIAAAMAANMGAITHRSDRHVAAPILFAIGSMFAVLAVLTFTPGGAS